MTWLVRGACRTEDPDLFFPVGTTGPALRQIEDAKSVCRQCEVADACLDWALRTGEDAGVWGGLSEEERRTLRLRRDNPSRARLRVAVVEEKDVELSS
ncbi:WhiB family transcriptional regulator [Kribbella sp. VKM Ac-2571]|uniref:WhiB family transcriptional regulator n=1 Tax=Kribbella sp. VKM Ac-2571 TaxID=2512222 RepID=UPI001060D5F3|nr:WhiB family transcriptional regulator [Kribbella sp. VKM Ac-2571]